MHANNTTTTKRTRRATPASTRVELGEHSYIEWLNIDTHNVRRAIAYIRLSAQTKTNRDNLGTQLDDSHKLAAANGCVIVAVIVEDGERAFDRDNITDRPGMLQLITLVERHECECVVAFQQERIFRDDLELALFKRYARKANVTLLSKNGVTAPGDPTSDAMSTILGAIGKLDSAIKRERSYAKHVQLASKGAVANVGGIRPFGYEDDRVTINEAEQLAVVTALDSFLEGVSVREIARRMNEAGMLTPSAVKADGTKRGGNEWTITTLRQVLKSHRIAGLRLHRRTKLVSEAQWPPLVERGKWELAQHLFADPQRRTNERRRKYMLSGGLLHCGVCDAALISRPHRGVRRYICSKERGGCGGVSINADAVELRANELVRTFLADGVQPGVVRFSIAVEANELADVQAALKRIQTGWADGRLDDAAFDEQQRRLLDRQRTLRAAVVRSETPEWVKQPGATAKRWDTLDDETRRSVVAYCVEHFVIERRDGRTGPRFDPSRVVPLWSARTK